MRRALSVLGAFGISLAAPASAGAACAGGLVGTAPICFDTVEDWPARIAVDPPTAGVTAGDPVGLTWTSEGPTAVAVDVSPPGYPSTTLVRQIGSSDVATSGALTWDLTDAAGAPVPDGTYLLTLRALAYPDRPRHATAVTVDRTPPSLGVLKLPASRMRALRVRVREHGAGIKAVVLSVDGRPRVALSDPGRFRPGLPAGATVRMDINTIDLTWRPPKHGWKPGRRTFTLTGRDAAGHAAAPLTGSFQIKR
ncbi:MAG: hypothetical protein JHC95_07795 [Solirubrobacteraceae bacterium]|nr:hypothetical protein [Solirubrobacteraceae bacterium]